MLNATTKINVAHVAGEGDSEKLNRKLQKTSENGQLS